MKTASVFILPAIIVMLLMTVQVMLARYLGPTGIGTFILAITVANILALLAHFKLSLANSYFAYHYPKQRRTIVGNNLFFTFCWGAFFTILIIVLIMYLPERFLPEINIRLWWMAMVVVIPLMLLELSNGLLIGLNWKKRLFFLQIVGDAIILTGILWLFNRNTLAIDCAVAIWVISHVIMAFAIASLSWWKAGLPIHVRPMLLRRMVSFGIQSRVSIIFSYLIIYINILMISYFLSHQEIGYYSVAFVLVFVLWYFPSAVAKQLAPQIYQKENHNDSERTALLVRLGFTSSLTGAIILGVMGWLLIKLIFGEDFLPAYLVLIALLPGGVVIGSIMILSRDLFNRNYSKYTMIINIIGFVTITLFNLFLIPKYGITGAAISASITFLLIGLAYYCLFASVSGIAIRDLLIIKHNDLVDLFTLIRS
ncbi:MAG: oligosaccharide flippase family protein [Candidatus Hatepunaea meridiana]|nr:oligosaccharide flippase family protein [Candidatus Hatepunaea meridiana]